MAKIVTKKSQIPKYAAKRIKDFKNLTTNQAIYEYELQKLQRRAKGEYASFLSGYYARPQKVYKKDIEEIRGLRGKKLEQARYKYETDRRINRYVSDRADYYDVDDSIPDISPNVIDINKLIEQEITYKSPEEYLEETGQVVNPLTGEVISADNIADMVDFARLYLDQLEQLVQMDVDRAIVYSSSYRSGRTRSARSRQWVSDNISKAGNAILNQLESIRSSDDRMLQFARKFSNPDAQQELSEAIGEYLMGCYHITDTQEAFQASRVYALLSNGPMSLGETMEFEYEE